MFSVTFKAFVVFVTFLLFQSNLYIVLAHGKGPKNNFHRDLFKTKNPKQKTPVIKDTLKAFNDFKNKQKSI